MIFFGGGESLRKCFEKNWKNRIPISVHFYLYVLKIFIKKKQTYFLNCMKRIILMKSKFLDQKVTERIILRIKSI